MIWDVIKARMLRHLTQTLSEEDAHLTYEQVIVLVEDLAARLTLPCYAILCQSPLFSAISLLACMAAGVTAVPLTHRYGQSLPERQIQFIHPPGLLTDLNGELSALPLSAGGYTSYSPAPAVILCTSGTTGTPKGVMLSEKNLLSNVEDLARCYAFDPEDTVLITRPLCHSSVLTGELLFSLYKGLSIHFFCETFSPVALLGEVRKRKIGILGGTPTTFSLLSRCLSGGTPPSSLHTLLISGECLLPTVAETIGRAFPTQQIYHGYGLTEASPRVAYLHPAEFRLYPGLLGTPLPSVEIKIVDETGNPVPDGSSGEVLVRGPSIMMGYYHAPEQTAAVLQNGWLCTGDIARRVGSRWQILGRKDGMMIRAGMNIYPAEIENVLQMDPRVDEALAYPVERGGSPFSIGLKVRGRFENTEELRQLCLTCLAPYQQPSILELVDTLPKTVTGKIQR